MQKGRVILALTLVLSLCIRLWFATNTIETLVTKCLSDDSFYGFSLARNMARGLGPTFDGVTRTNGFPPLFIIFMLPVFYFFTLNLAMPVNVALIVMGIFDLLTGCLIYRILVKLYDWRAGLIGSAFWLLNPCLMLVTLTGCEASVCAFFEALCLLCYVRYRETKEVQPGRLAALGVSAGLAILARSDAIFLLAAVAVGALADSRLHPRRRIACCGAISALAMAVILPWMLWNIRYFGLLGPVSGLVKPFRSHNLYLREHGTYYSWALLGQIGIWAWNSLHTIGTSSGLTVYLFIPFAAAVLAQTVSRCRRKGEGLSHPLIVALLSAAGICCFYSLYFWQTHPWYFHSTLMVFCLALGCAGGAWASMLPARLRPVWPCALCGLIVLSMHRGALHWRAGLFPWQMDYVRVARDLRARFGTQDRFAAFNAGIYHYFSEVTLINIDASVNNEVYYAMQGHTLFNDYLKERRIRYIVDQEYVVRMYWALYGPKGDIGLYLRPVVRVGVPWRFSSEEPADIVIYEVNWAAPATRP